MCCTRIHAATGSRGPSSILRSVQRRGRYVFRDRLHLASGRLLGEHLFYAAAARVACTDRMDSVERHTWRLRNSASRVLMLKRLASPY